MNKWIDDCIFYHIYPLGFCGAPKKNEGERTKGSRILDVIKWIPHMKKLGVNALYIGPVFESESHGYDTNDYFKIDSRLGTNDEFKSLCKEAHKSDIKIILDGVFNHVGRGFSPFKDLQKNKQSSPYADWFRKVDFGADNSFGDGFRYDAWQGHEVLVNLNLYNPEVREYLLGAVEFWIDEFDIDGIRLDAVDCVGTDFCRELRKAADKKKPDFWLMGELVSGNYLEFLSPEILDSATNYECYKGFYSCFNSRNLCEIVHSINRQKGDYGIYKDFTLYNFADNHDVSRIASMLNDKRDLFPLYTVLFTMPGVPSVYYGSEWGIEGKKTGSSDDPMRPRIDVDNPRIDNPELMEHIAKLSRIRKESPALRYGSFVQVAATPLKSVFARKYKDETMLVFLNISENDETIEAYFDGKNISETLPPHSSKTVKLDS